jgi:NADH dehydrogenase [ubiquinone] 1 alpha subcomplex assembly factor 7
MEVALYAPGGFFDRLPVGIGADFVTSPHVHPVFGALLAEALRGLWDLTTRTDRPAVILELGAGDGTLAAQLTQALPDVEYVAVERSHPALEELRRRGFSAFPTLAETPIEPGAPVLVVANELFDNLPFHRLVRRDQGLVEILIDLDDSLLVEVERPCPLDLDDLCPPLSLDEEACVSPSAMHLMDEIAALALVGGAVLIDYARIPGGSGSSVHGYRRHREASDVLAEPGATDITAGVDMGGLADRARSRGMTVHGLVAQRDALRALGFREWAAAQTQQQAEALDRRSGRDAVATWNDRQAAQLLVDPDGLGGFRWLVLGPLGSKTPAWIPNPLPAGPRTGTSGITAAPVP